MSEWLTDLRDMCRADKAFTAVTVLMMLALFAAATFFIVLLVSLIVVSSTAWRAVEVGVVLAGYWLFKWLRS